MDNPTNLFNDIKRTQKEMEHLFQHVFGHAHPLLRVPQGRWRPNVDVFECGENIVVLVELAGVEREDISVTFEDGKLHIGGIRKDIVPYKGRKYCQMEISYNEFERVVYLPNDVDVERITAKLNNGFVIIEAPKRNPEKPDGCQIKIR
ncbi:MAG: Hsp20/alpha crystallin family protein [Candidatus Abyssobacteria bacterium SURF_17]|uniref:Hsp20/alpha crystallin family protein n=1 Tax=Candidatus Abyssobacteria bacterium SURF_17 TaxID=2093361 RepID=A0A419EVU9_9BACT|nr:MAG: Hsp20/alpha crystallin family protein [Candidatus Abyssubacteria bacterium SURF_17]